MLQHPGFRFHALALACAASLAHAGSGAPNGRRTLVPNVVATTPPYQVVGRAIEATTNLVRVRAQPLDEEERADYFRMRTRLGRDPLPDRASYPGGLLVFEVSMQNSSGQDVTFSPALGNCWYTSDNEIRHVQSDVLFSLLRAGHEGEPNPEQAASEDMRAFHVDPIVLHDGQRVTRLLVFEGVPFRARQVTLDLEQFFVGAAEIRPTFKFLVTTRPPAAIPPAPQATRRTAE